MKVLSKSRDVGYLCANFIVFLGLSVLELGQMYTTVRRQTKESLNASALWGGIITAFATEFPFVQSRGDIHYTVLPRGGAYYALVLSVRHVRSSKSRMESHANVEFGEVFPTTCNTDTLMSGESH